MVELDRKIRALWEQHIYWTRLAINSIVGRLPDEKQTIDRLLRNPKDFAALLEPLYGTASASRFDQLLTEHLVVAAELVKALQAGNMTAAEDANKRWYANADTLALFLSQINPYWSEQEWRRMLHEHLKLVAAEATTRLAGDYVQNIALNDRMQTQAMEMADIMTHGLIRQFPSAFH